MTSAHRPTSDTRRNSETATHGDDDAALTSAIGGRTVQSIFDLRFKFRCQSCVTGGKFRLVRSSDAPYFSRAILRLGVADVAHVFVVASSALILVVAIRSRERPRVWSRARVALAVLVWLRLVDKAALGDRRPVFERQRKGTAAILLAAGG